MAGWLQERRPVTRDERGAVAVFTALMMVVLVGAAGLGIDTANTTMEHQNVQRGVDSAALAIATDCALGYSTCSPSANATTAEYFVGQNDPGATVDQPVVPSAGGQVTVSASETVPTSLMKVLGIDNANVSAEAVATWGGHPVAGDPVLPLAIPYCEWLQNKPGTSSSPIVLRTDLMNKINDNLTGLGLLADVVSTTLNWLSPVTDSCTTPDGQNIATLRGPVWLSGVNTVLSNVLTWIPSTCTMHIDDVNAYVGGTASSLVEPAACISKLGTTIKPGTTILLPIYKPYNHLLQLGLQTKTCVISLLVKTCVKVPPELGVDIIGYAPFTVSGWQFPAEGNTHPDPAAPCTTQLTTPSLVVVPGVLTIPGLSVGCTGLTGRFVRTVVSDPNFTYSTAGADFGAGQVKLTK